MENLLMVTYQGYNPLTKKRDSFRGKLLTNKTYDVDDIIKEIRKNGGSLNTQTYRYAFSGLAETVPELIRKCACRCQIGDLVTLYPVITGTFPSASAPFDPARNAIEIHATTPGTLRYNLSDVSIYNVTEKAISPAISSVEDLTLKDTGTIRLGHSMQIVGKDLLLSDKTDEGLFLSGGTLPAEMAMVVTGANMTSVGFSTPEDKTAADIPPGDYTLTIRTRAGRPVTAVPLPCAAVLAVKVAAA